MTALSARWGGLTPWRALRSVRRWIAVPIALGVLGAVIGAGAAQAAQPTAQARLLLQSTTQDGAAMQQLVETSVQQIGSSSIFDAAARASGTDAYDLMHRTRVAAVPNSLLMTVTVTASTPERATTEAQSVADAAVEESEAQAREQLARLTSATTALLTDPQAKTDDPEAERARIARIGNELAGNQSNLIANSGQLVVIQDASPLGRTISVTTLAAAGGGGGVLLGVLLALVLGTGRGRLSSVNELHRLYPDVTAVPPHQVPTLLALEPDPISMIIVAGVRTSAEAMQTMSQSICDAVVLTGGNAYLSGQLRPLLDPASTEPPQAHGRGPNGTERTMRPTRLHDDGVVSVVTTELSPAVLHRATRHADALLFLVVEPGRTRLEQLDRVLPTVGDRVYVLVPEETTPWGR